MTDDEFGSGAFGSATNLLHKNLVCIGAPAGGTLRYYIAFRTTRKYLT